MHVPTSIQPRGCGARIIHYDRPGSLMEINPKLDHANLLLSIGGRLDAFDAKQLDGKVTSPARGKALHVH